MVSTHEIDVGSVTVIAKKIPYVGEIPLFQIHVPHEMREHIEGMLGKRRSTRWLYEDRFVYTVHDLLTLAEVEALADDVEDLAQKNGMTFSRFDEVFTIEQALIDINRRG